MDVKTKLRVKWAGEHNKTLVLSFKENQGGNGEDLQVELDDNGVMWVIVAFRMVDNKMHLIRYTSVGDKRVATDGNGRILEVDE